MGTAWSPGTDYGVHGMSPGELVNFWQAPARPATKSWVIGSSSSEA